MPDSKRTEPTIFSNNKQFFLLVDSIKYFYIACIIVFFSIAVLYNKYSPKVYEVNASIVPVQNDATSMLSSNELFRGLETLQANNNIENEVNNLRSFSRVSSTISRLNFEVGYFSEKNKLFKEPKELYKISPYTVNIDKSHIQPIGNKFYIYLINESTFRLISSSDEVTLYNYVDNHIVSSGNYLKIDTICKFNETIKNRFFSFSVSYNKEFMTGSTRDRRVYFEFYHLDYLAKDYYKRLIASRVSPMSSILTVQFSGENIDKVLAFLNNYLDLYFEESLTKKNKIAVSTINFIDSQLSEISDSLVLSESRLRNYRSANQVMDLSFQGQKLYESLQEIDNERSNLLVQQRYYNYVIDYFNKNRDVSGIAPPSAMNVVDPIMTQLVTDLYAMNSERSSILGNNNEKNLFLGQIENKIAMQKEVIIENVTNNLNTLSLSLNELNYRGEKLSKEISMLPKTELNMVNMQRKFNLNDVIYTFLLQKRSEAAIAMASNYPDYQILEPARAITSRIVAPKVMFNYLVAILLALVIPTGFLIIKELFNDKIRNVFYIEQLLNRSALGVVPDNEYKTEAVVAEFPQSSIAESFRNIRSSLFFKLKSQSSKIVVISSSQPKDGKSFVSFNLASSIASVGYKTILIDCDLHRPTLHLKFKEENSVGLSNYMINEASLKDIIHNTSVENLAFISAGPILPNPSELMESGVLDEMIDQLKKDYDYILIDTTPVGIVADAILMMKYASQILLICRTNYTRKDVFANIIDSLNTHNFSNYDVILNGQSLKESPYGKYTSYYKKGKGSKNEI